MIKITIQNSGWMRFGCWLEKAEMMLSSDGTVVREAWIRENKRDKLDIKKMN